MAKIEVTKKDVLKTNCPVYKANYCELYALLKSVEAWGYNAGKLGYNWDVYDLATDAGVIRIVTGYRNGCGRAIPYAMARRYNEQARILTAGVSMHHWADKLKELQTQFIKELLSMEV